MTRSIRSGAWTSSSAPPRRPTTKRARFSRNSSSRSTLKGRERKKTYGQEKRRQPQRDGPQARQTVRRQAQVADGNRQQRPAVAGGALRCAPQARQAPAQLVRRTHSQPL